MTRRAAVGQAVRPRGMKRLVAETKWIVMGNHADSANESRRSECRASCATSDYWLSRSNAHGADDFVPAVTVDMFACRRWADRVTRNYPRRHAHQVSKRFYSGGVTWRRVMQLLRKTKTRKGAFVSATGVLRRRLTVRRSRLACTANGPSADLGRWARSARGAVDARGARPRRGRAADAFVRSRWRDFQPFANAATRASATSTRCHRFCTACLKE